MLRNKAMNRNLKKLTVLTTTALLTTSFVLSQVKPVNAGFFDFFKKDDSSNQEYEDRHNEQGEEQGRYRFGGSMNGSVEGDREQFRMQGSGEMEYKGRGNFGKEMLGGETKRDLVKGRIRDNLRDNLRDKKVRSILGREIREQCANIKDREGRRACVQEVVVKNLDKVIERSIARVERIKKLVENSRTIDAKLKRQAVDKLNKVIAELQALASDVQNKKITVQDAAKKLREINQEVREVMQQLRGSIGKRAHAKLQRVLQVVQRVFAKIKDRLGPVQLQQAEQIISQLQAIVAKPRPTDPASIKQEIATVRSLMRQFREIVRSLRESSTTQE